MPTLLTLRSTGPGQQLGPSWAQRWAADRFGRAVGLHVFETSVGTIAYIPDHPVVPIRMEGRAAFNLTIKLSRPPDGRSREVPTSLIEGGFCTLSLTLNLNLPPPYVPLFVRKADFSIKHSGSCLATTSAAGAGASVSFSLTLEPEIVLDILRAISGHGSRMTVVAKLDLRWTGSPSDCLDLVSPLQEILESIPGESRLVSVVAPNWDRTGYETIPRLVDNIRYRNGPAEAERIPVVASSHSLVPLQTTIAPKPSLAANAHVLLASAAQPASTSATHIHAAFLHDLSLVGTPLPSGEHLPLVDNPSGNAFPDGVDKTSYWYPLTFRIVPPEVSDDVEVSSFAFLFRRTGMTGGVSPRPTLEGSVRIVASPEMGEDTKLALANAGASQSQPLPLEALAATLEIPYMESGVVKTQSLRADVEQQASTYHFTIALLDDAVRTAYGSLAYPNTFQSQPARLRIAYSYRAYVPVPLNWPQIAFGGKIATAPAALALHVARGATGSGAVKIGIRPALMISPQILLAAQKVRYAVRSVAREQSIDLRFPCSELGALYLDETEEPSVPVGCTDALELGQFKIKSYEELVDLRTDRYRIYQALSQPGTFLVVPNAYKITRYGPKDGDDKAYRPAAMLYAVVDPEATKSKFYFLATLQPDIAVDARIALEGALVSKSPAGTNPSIQYPTELTYITSPNFSWVLPDGVDQPVTQVFPDSFSVSITTGMDDALLLVNLVQTSGITGSVTFTLEDGSSVQSGLILDTDIVGPWEGGPVATEINGASVKLTNKIERPVNIFDLETRTGGATGTTHVNQTLAPGASLTMDSSSVIDQAYCTYSIQGGDIKLEELRIFVEDVSTNVIFINQVNLANHGLTGLKAQARLTNADHIYDLDDVSGPSTTLSLSLPITSYLSAQTLQYRITKVSGNGTTSVTTWLEADLSKSNVVSITWDAIQN